jgi:hypothetical protein
MLGETLADRRLEAWLGGEQQAAHEIGRLMILGEDGSWHRSHPDELAGDRIRRQQQMLAWPRADQPRAPSSSSSTRSAGWMQRQ